MSGLQPCHACNHKASAQHEAACTTTICRWLPHSGHSPSDLCFRACYHSLRCRCGSKRMAWHGRKHTYLQALVHLDTTLRGTYRFSRLALFYSFHKADGLTQDYRTSCQTYPAACRRS